MSNLRSITSERAERIVNINTEVLYTRQQNALLPAVNLPPEILATIFEFACCPDDGHWLANVGLKTQKDYFRDRCSLRACAVTPLFIGTICSAWRSIAWDTPQLWTSIALLYSDDIAEKLAEMLDYWLSKSGHLPLSVALVEDEDCNVPVIGKSSEVIDVIAAYARRLHAVDLLLPRPWEPALVRIAGCAPLLTRLKLCMVDNGDQYNPSISITDASQLREVTLSMINIADVSLPWAQLESLDVNSQYDDVSDLVETLRLCPRLRRFSVYLGDLDWDAPLSVMLRHTALEALEVSGYDQRFHPELFKVLELPALRSFTLHVDTYSGPHEWSFWLPSLLSHVAGTLETLHISPEAPPDEDLVTMLRAVPKLRKLVLVDFYPETQKEHLTQRTLDLMKPTKYEGLEHEVIGQLDGEGGGDETGNGHCLVPNLETFEYKGEIDFTSHALVEFLVARWRGHHLPLRRTSALGLESPHGQLEGSGQHQHRARGPLPPNDDAPSTRLRSVTFKTPKQIEFEGADAEVVQELRLEGMHLEFLRR
jgi:hypothetical protein